MSYALYIGRVGALAVALGIEAALAGVPGVASAGPEPGSDPSDPTGSSSQSSSTDAGSQSGTDPDPQPGSGPDSDPGLDHQDPAGPGVAGDSDADNPNDSGGGMHVSSSGGAVTSTARRGGGVKSNDIDRESDPPKRRPLVKPSSVSRPSLSGPKIPTGSVHTSPDVSSHTTDPGSPGVRSTVSVVPVSQSAKGAVDVAPAARTAAVAPVATTIVAAPVATTIVAAPKTATPTMVSRVLSSLVRLTPGTANDVPTAPVESPVLLGLMAGWRRLSQQDSMGDQPIQRAADSPQSSSMLMVAVASSAPTAVPSKGVPNATTGVIVGNVNASDADGNQLTYSVTGQPTSGSATVDGVGVFTYTPTLPARLRAGQTAAVDPDSFTISVSDGQGGVTPVTVPVAVLPALVAAQTDIPQGAGSNPSAVAVYKNLTYVANASAKTVKVINTDTNQVIATVPVQNSPSAIAVSPDGKAVWVANAGSKTVQRIDTQSNTVVATVTVGTTPTALAVTSDSVWVANAGSNSVSRISTATNKVVATTTVGLAPSAIAVSGDRVYVANKIGNSISVISTTTNKVVTTKSAVTAPSALAVNGGKLYVTQQTLNRVLVLNSSTMVQEATIAVQSAPTSVAISPDGVLAYVANSNDRVSVIDTKTNTVLSTVVIDTDTTGGHAIALDGTATNPKIYVTDASDNTLRVLSLIRGNTAPITGTPTVDSTNLSTGDVTGSLNFEDTDGDSLTYSLASQPVSSTITGTPIGSVSFTPAGGYTFTPSRPARDVAAQTSAADTATFTVRATDASQAYKDVTVTVPISPTPPPNSAPWIPGATIPRTLDPVTGTVTGYMNVRDNDGDALTFTLTEQPAQGGTVTFDQKSGYFAYTPSEPARAQAAQTSGLDYDTFGVDITDGIAIVHTTVRVQVAPALPPTVPTTNNSLTVGAGPSGVAVSNGNTYVINYDSGTVTVTNTATKQLVTTLDVGSGPLSVAAVDTAQRKRVYVSNSLSNTVSVIDATTNTVIDTIAIPIPPGVYENPEWGVFEYQNQITEVAASGDRLYVNATDGTLRVFDTTNDANVLIRTDAPGTFNDLELSPDGRRLYGTSGSALTVFDTATMTPTTVVVGPGGWEENAAGDRAEYTDGVGTVAVSPDGKRTYVAYSVTILQRGVGGQSYGSFITKADGTTWMVTGDYSAISVIDTDPTSANYNKEIARIQVPLGAQDLAVGAGKLYVANSDNKTVTIIDTATNTPVGSFTTDESSSGREGIYVTIDGYPMFAVPSYSRYTAVGPDGTVYVTDYADGKLYAVTTGSINV